ncbi:GNAT family N-acetyltransferase [Lewinella sp. W8]|uniref:GNAT family N-acetyltransferase n=1 Tax=Lewinella sp. W8 TaxID=2528208 RepID=UPI0010672EC0|nr:GNAT family N-acetyltransferase [Lewinella sp. W8]MTB49737.1 GNAT family N-acetyltransferase [Lewinella sp. W8]
MPVAFLPTVCSHAPVSRTGVIPIVNFPDWQLLRVEAFGASAVSWPGANRPDDYWVQKKNLQFLEKNPQGIETKGLVLRHRPSGRQILLTEQTFFFHLAGQVSDNAKGETSRFDFRRRMLSPFSFKILCLGQFLTSGDYCQDGLELLTPRESIDLLSGVADSILQHDPSYTGVLLKDLFPTDHSATEELRNRGYFLLPTDPVMELEIPDHWRSMDDYLEDITSKYRVRYRRARGKMEGLSSRALSPLEINIHLPRIYDLYTLTSSGADFNAAKLKQDYFGWLAGQEEVNVKGYFDQYNHLVAFTTTIANGPILHAHYLGMEDAFKHSHHLYHNILFDLLESAIEGGFQKLDFGRTALEIKSSIGAVPKEFACLLKARSGIINRLIPLFTPAVYTAQAWTPRSPFKASTVSSRN